jgi:Glyoxalase/Bleomycin resistance protein/Dioxygenase superfamily
MATVNFERIAPVVTVKDVDAALARYRQLGFATELDISAQYGFVERGDVQLHLQPGDSDGPGGTGGVAYLYVSDAQALYVEWASAGVGGRFIEPHDTPYGLREFVYTDPDGMVHRVGSPLGPGERGPESST